jgi:hypothetical protein
MKTYKQFISDEPDRTDDPTGIDESLLRTGSAAVLAAKGKNAGDAAARNYREAHDLLKRAHQRPRDTAEAKLDMIISALSLLADGHQRTRDQIGNLTAMLLISATSQSR